MTIYVRRSAATCTTALPAWRCASSRCDHPDNRGREDRAPEREPDHSVHNGTDSGATLTADPDNADDTHDTADAEQQDDAECPAQATKRGPLSSTMSHS